MIDSNTVFFSNISNKGINYVGQLFKTNEKIKGWEEITTKLSLENITECSLLMVYLVLEKKHIRRQRNLLVYDNHLIKNSQVYAFNKLNSNYYMQSKI